jgi:hypothetical protein
VGAHLDAVIATQELVTRLARKPDRQAEERGFALLRRELDAQPRSLLHKLSDLALELCRAHSAGVSLLEGEPQRRFFRWHAASGQWAHNLWKTLPREASPCGAVLDRRSAQLMVLPERHFTRLAHVEPKVFEALLIPFPGSGEIIGTLWVLAHDASRRFDIEDLRIMADLADFASKVYAHRRV